MLKFIGRNIITGIVTILPVALTFYLLYWLVVSAETALGSVIRALLPGIQYWQGIGVFAALAVTFLIGLLMHAYVVQQLFEKTEQIMYRMPLINSVYKAFRDFIQYFSPDKKKEFEQVVKVAIADTGVQAVGFVTQAIPERLPEGLRDEESVLVYFPLSYMIGGYALLVPRKFITPLDMSMEEAMRFTLTAGVTGVTNHSSGVK